MHLFRLMLENKKKNSVNITNRSFQLFIFRNEAIFFKQSIPFFYASNKLHKILHFARSTFLFLNRGWKIILLLWNCERQIGNIDTERVWRHGDEKRKKLSPWSSLTFSLCGWAVGGKSFPLLPIRPRPPVLQSCRHDNGRPVLLI